MYFLLYLFIIYTIYITQELKTFTSEATFIVLGGVLNFAHSLSLKLIVNTKKVIACGFKTLVISE